MGAGVLERGRRACSSGVSIIGISGGGPNVLADESFPSTSRIDEVFFFEGDWPLVTYSAAVAAYWR